jgi:hypothetical protein
VALARPKNALVASLNFHPGHFSHLVASYRLLADSGYAPHLYVHRSFNAMDVEGEFRKINRPGELRGLGTVDVAVFWFPSLRNVLEILRLRLRFGTKVVYVNHEPWDSFASYRASGFGLRQIAKVWLISLVNLSVILLSSGVVLPSSGAYALYRQKFAWLNRNYRRIPLLFDDEEKGGTDHGREFVSYVGTVAADHAFDRFVEFVDAAVTNEWLPGLRFLIATRSEIPERERAILARHLPSGRVVVVEGRPMSNQEINGHFQRSLVVWNAYHRSMQSGILPKAYMFGAPVVTLRRNGGEFVDDHVTGVLIERNDDPVEIREAVEEIRRSPGAFARASREKFLKTFHYEVAIDDFRQLLGG